MVLTILPLTFFTGGDIIHGINQAVNKGFDVALKHEETKQIAINEGTRTTVQNAQTALENHKMVEANEHRKDIRLAEIEVINLYVY